MEPTTWQGFVHVTACHPADDGLRISLEDRPDASLPAAVPDFTYCRDLIARHHTHGLPIWLRLHENTIERVRFVHVATVFQLTPEPLGGAFLVFSDTPTAQYLPDTHPERVRLLEIFSRAFRDNSPVLYALEEEGLIADAGVLAGPEASRAQSIAAVEQAAV